MNTDLQFYTVVQSHPHHVSVATNGAITAKNGRTVIVIKADGTGYENFPDRSPGEWKTVYLSPEGVKIYRRLLLESQRFATRLAAFHERFRILDGAQRAGALKFRSIEKWAMMSGVPDISR